MFQKQSQVPKKPKENKCKITIKKRKDGSVVKEVEGTCTKEQLRALSSQDSQNIED